mmetsp:Transcript_3711/g.7387  ORF Transcript_3711/g.7387 Transcript_3711/m.7387 type:complete len:236 (-) Transcript_3711:179-886(-)
MALWIGDLLLVDDLVLQIGNQFAIFCMYSRQDSELFAAGKSLNETGIVQHESILVRHEHFEGVDPSLLLQLLYLLLHGFIPLCDATVKGVIATGGLAVLVVPLLVGLKQDSLFSGRRRDDKVNEQGGTSLNGTFGSSFGSLANLAHKGELQMHVWINASWHDVFARSVNHLDWKGVTIIRRRGNVDVRGDLENLAIFSHENVGLVRVVSIHDGAVFNEIAGGGFFHVLLGFLCVV